MLEEALKQDPSSHACNVSWCHSSAHKHESKHRHMSEAWLDTSTPVFAEEGMSGQNSSAPRMGINVGMSTGVPPMPASSTIKECQFFKFCFSGGSTSAWHVMLNGLGTGVGVYCHLNSPSLPSLPQAHVKEVEEVNEMLREEQAVKRKVEKEKAALEADLEALSQALFKEVCILLPVYLPALTCGPGADASIFLF